MGQRLNIEITSGETPLANAYYHWSGYSSSACELTKIIIDAFDTVKDMDKIPRAVSLLQATGAGFPDDEIEETKNILPKDFNIRTTNNRNMGLISIMEKGMGDTRYWEEARVTIDLDTEKIKFNVFYIVEEELERINSKKTLDFNPFDMGFDEIEKLNQFVNDPEKMFIVNDKYYSCIY